MISAFSSMAKRAKEPVWFFIITASVFGSIIGLMTPPFQVADEFQHFFRAYTLSEGHFGPRISSSDVGEFLPSSLGAISEPFRGLPFHPSVKTSFYAIRQTLAVPLESDVKKWFSFPGSSIYFPAAYVPQTIFLSLRALGVNPAVLFYMGRFGALVFWIAGIALAINVIPHSKWILVALALSPMSIFQAPSFSADVTTNALSFLLASFYFSLYFRDKKFKISEVMGIILLSGFISILKIAYAPMSIIFLFVSPKKFNNSVEYVSFLSLMLVANVIFPLLWTLNVSRYTQHIPYGVDIRATLAYVMNNPLHLPSRVVLSIIRQFSRQASLYIGTLGWLDVELSYFIKTGWAATLFALVVSKDNMRSCLPMGKMAYACATCCATFIGIYVTLYFTCTKPGAYEIFGVQGRYFIPLGPLFFVTLAAMTQHLLGSKSTDLLKRWIPIRSMLVAILAATSWSIYARYYL